MTNCYYWPQYLPVSSIQWHLDCLGSHVLDNAFGIVPTYPPAIKMARKVSVFFIIVGTIQSKHSPDGSV
jgi:hypothetical protein